MPQYPEISRILKTKGAQICATSLNNNHDLWEAYAIVGGLIEYLISVGRTEFKDVDNSISARLSLTANLIQSFYVVEQLISEGAYWAAAAVLRQHMETLARIIEYRNGKQQDDKRTPNVSLLSFGLNKNYGRLSQLCHTTDWEVLEDFSDSCEMDASAKVTPQFRMEWARDLFASHIAHMLQLAYEIMELHKEKCHVLDFNTTMSAFEKIAKLLVNSGFWQEVE